MLLINTHIHGVVLLLMLLSLYHSLHIHGLLHNLIQQTQSSILLTQLIHLRDVQLVVSLDKMVLSQLTLVLQLQQIVTHIHGQVALQLVL